MNRKANRTITALLLAIAAYNLQSPAAFAQGSLMPPGAPAPVMKSLAQIEPRTPIAFAPFTISVPGSYYLTTNLVGVSGTNGITIACGNVTLDLAGFALTGVTESFHGVQISGGHTNVTVRNGTISGWGIFGVDAFSYSPHNVRLERLNVLANGAHGLAASDGMVRDCCCTSNHSMGILIERGMVSDCMAHNNGGYGILADRSTVRACHARNNAGYGIYAGYSTVSGCYVADNVQSGIIAYYSNCQIIGNNCFHNNTSGDSSHAGIFIYDNANRVEDNHVTASGFAGIQVDGGYANNVIVKNTVIGNGTNNYIIPAGQVVGPFITVTGTITNSNPWANFSY